MKRVLSLVLALALVLGSIPAGFAATATAGETLKGYGLLTGDQNGNLNEGTDITRGEMMVVLARLLGKFEEAKAYSIPSTSKDVNNHWAAHYIAFAEKESWTAGKGNGMFDPQGKVTLQETAAFMMKALGYTVTDFSKVVEEATAKGLLKDVTGAASAPILRGSLFVAALNTLNTPMKDSTVTLGVKLGVLVAPVAASVKITAASAVAHNVVSVTLDAAATTVDAKMFTVVDKDAKAVEVKGATLISSKTVWLDTADLTAGTVYTVKSGDAALKFTAIQKDTTALNLLQGTSMVLDNITVKLTFDKKLDPRKALVAANYTIDNKLTVASVAFGKDKDGVDVRTEVLLTTSAQTANQIYKVTVGANVTDYFGNKVKSDDSANVLSFGGIKADVTAPKLTSATAVNAVKVVLNFTDDSDLSMELATNIANYTIKNTTAADKVISVTAAKLVKDATTGKYTVVELTTTAQVTSNKYEVAVANVTDKFGNVINSTATKATFYGQAPDTSAPSITVATAVSNTLVKVIFNEDLDATSAETAANYAFNKSLTVVKAAVDADNDNIVWLTTSAQKGAEVYELTVTNVKDGYNNAITSSKVSFAGIALNETAPTVVAAYAKVESGVTYVYVTFDMNMNATTAKVASNYYFGDAIGYGISGAKSSDTVYKIRVNALTENKLYTVTVSNVTSIDDILVKDTKNTAQFVGVTTADTEKPAVTTAVALDARTMKVAFSKAMANGTPASATNIDNVAAYTIYNATTVTSGVALTTTPVVKTIIVGDDENEVTIRYTADVFVSGQVYKVVADAALVAKNNTTLILDSAKNSATFGGNATAVTVPKIVGVYSINKSTVDVKFNVPVQIKTAASTAGLTFTPAVGTDVTTTADNANTTVLSTDKYTLRVSTLAELTGGAKYSINANALTNVIEDLYADQTVSSTSATTDFYANSSTNTKPAISSVSTNTGSSLLVVMSEDVKPFTGTSFDMTMFKVNGFSATRVQYKDSTVNKTDLIVYYNNDLAAATAGAPYVGAIGSVKEFKILANGVKDLIGAANEETKANFVVSSNERTAPKITDVVVVKGSVGYDKVRVVFNTTVNNVSLSDFTVTSGGVAITGFTYQLTDASAVTDGATSYYSIIDLVFIPDLIAGTTVQVTFNGTGSQGKDGKAAELTSTDSAVVPN